MSRRRPDTVNDALKQDARANRQNDRMNQQQYWHYYDMLEQMWCSTLRWENLPTEIDQRFLNMTLFEQGMAVFFHDDEYDAYFATRATRGGYLNMYDNPLEYTAFGTGDFRRTLKSSECVPIYSNYLRKSDSASVEIYARRLADIDRTLDVNLAEQKMPVFVRVKEEQKVTVKNLLMQWTANEPIIIGDTGIMNDIDMGYLSPGVPLIAKELLSAKQTIWAEVMTFLGIDNSNISKGERVQTAEVQANNGQIEASRLIRLNTLRKACAEINRKYPELGENVWVDMNKDLSSMNYNSLMTRDDNPADTNNNQIGGDGE